MTDRDLTTLLREHTQNDEPPFSISAETAIALGRRTLRRRKQRGLAGVIVAAAAVAAIPLLPWHGSTGSDDHTGIDPATAAALEHYDAQRMPELLDWHVRMALSKGTAPSGQGLEGLRQAEFTASDDQGEKLPVRSYDKASAMSVKFRGDGDLRVSVTLRHARSETAGDARKTCAEDVASGVDFRCTVTVSGAGDPITTKVRAVAGVYFVRIVESVHSGTFLTSAQETVQAPDLATAEKLWQVPVADLEEVVTDPELVIPKPQS